MNTADEESRIVEPGRHALDHLVPDPTGMPPLYGAEEFEESLVSMVADTAPRLFAVVPEYGTRGWTRESSRGLAHEDHVDVIGVDRNVLLGVARPENVLRPYRWRDRLTARVVWYKPSAATRQTTVRPTRASSMGGY